MIEDVISISTLMICTFLSTVVIGIFMLQVWLTDRRHAAAGLFVKPPRGGPPHRGQKKTQALFFL